MSSNGSRRLPGSVGTYDLAGPAMASIPAQRPAPAGTAALPGQATARGELPRGGVGGSIDADLPVGAALDGATGQSPSRTEPRWAALREIRLLARGRPDRNTRQIALMSLGIGLILIANVFGQVRLNEWNGTFFDALEQRGLADFGRQLVLFLEIAGVLLGLVVAQTWLQQLLKIRLRERLTARQLDAWLAEGRAYRLAMTSELGVNPDQRMQEDTRLLTELSVELGIGVLQSTMLLVSFVGVLWTLSAQVSFTVAGMEVVVPGYMVWCAVAYALLGSFLTWLVGHPMIQLNAQRYAREAEFRFALVRVSENVESIALYGGEGNERRGLDQPLRNVLAAMRRLSGALSRLTWITSGYGWLAMVVPILVAAPSYFGGHLSLGGLMMVVGAFNQVQIALRYYVDNFPRFADWRAALRRVSEFCEAADQADEVDDTAPRLTFAAHPREALAFEHVSLLLANGTAVVSRATAEIGPGERVLITGPSGSGKSTLMRAIAGLWPWGSGTILLPPREQMMFMPQRPYLPLGTLGSAVTYPAPPGRFPASEVVEVLGRVGLEELVPMLDVEERWDKALSIGQQQRLAFARLLLQRPRWVFLDEATSALDEDNQMRVMAIFDRDLPETAVISIGHRPGLEVFHNRTLELVEAPDGARLRRKLPARIPDPTVDQLVAALFRRFLRD